LRLNLTRLPVTRLAVTRLRITRLNFAARLFYVLTIIFIVAIVRVIVGVIVVVLVVRLAVADRVVAALQLVAILLIEPRRVRLIAVCAAFILLLAISVHGRLAVLRAFAILLLQQALARHRGRHHAIIVFGVLEIRFVPHAVAARLRVTSVLCVLLVDLRGRAPDFYIRSIALERSVAVVMVVIATTTTAAAAAGLTPAPPLTLHVTFPDLQSMRPIWTDCGLPLQTQTEAG